jgi:hypothetical protein
MKNSSDPAWFLLNLSDALKAIEGDDATIAQQLLSDHPCFDGANNALTNIKTAKQGIDYVVRELKLAGDAGTQLKTMYESFQAEYDTLVDRGRVDLRRSGTASDYLRQLAASAREVAHGFSFDYAEQVSALTAHIFAYWTLHNAKGLALVSEEGDGLRDHLKKPHAPQVVAIWTLLNCAGMSDVQELQNHLVELKTGEGKSIVLGIAAIVLALFECDVSCVCYSSYLSDRDFSDFESMFHDFGVADRVHYGTLQNLCERI